MRKRDRFGAGDAPWRLAMRGGMVASAPPSFEPITPPQGSGLRTVIGFLLVIAGVAIAIDLRMAFALALSVLGAQLLAAKT